PLRGLACEHCDRDTDRRKDAFKRQTTQKGSAVPRLHTESAPIINRFGCGPGPAASRGALILLSVAKQAQRRDACATVLAEVLCLSCDSEGTGELHAGRRLLSAPRGRASHDGGSRNG